MHARTKELGGLMDFVELNGTAIRYELKGEKGPLVVLIHEMGGTRTCIGGFYTGLEILFWWEKQ